MPGLRRALVALFAVGVLCAARRRRARPDEPPRRPEGRRRRSSGPLIGLSFIGTGVFAWWRRPLNRFGLLMTAVGFAWFVGALVESDDAVVSTIGSYVGPLYLVLVVQLLLVVPDRPARAGDAARDRGRRVHRRVRPDAAGLPARRRHQQRLDGAPDNAFAIVHARGVADVDRRASRRSSASGSRRRPRRSCCASGGPRPPPQRRAQAPMLWTGLTRDRRASASLFGGDAVGVPDEVLGRRRLRRLRRVRDPARSRSSPASCGRATRAPARSAA